MVPSVCCPRVRLSRRPSVGKKKVTHVCPTDCHANCPSVHSDRPSVQPSSVWTTDRSSKRPSTRPSVARASPTNRASDLRSSVRSSVHPSVWTTDAPTHPRLLSVTPTIGPIRPSVRWPRTSVTSDRPSYAYVLRDWSRPTCPSAVWRTFVGRPTGHPTVRPLATHERAVRLSVQPAVRPCAVRPYIRLPDSLLSARWEVGWLNLRSRDDSVSSDMSKNVLLLDVRETLVVTPWTTILQRHRVAKGSIEALLSAPQQRHTHTLWESVH